MTNSLPELARQYPQESWEDGRYLHLLDERVFQAGEQLGGFLGRARHGAKLRHLGLGRVRARRGGWARVSHTRRVWNLWRNVCVGWGRGCEVFGACGSHDPNRRPEGPLIVKHSHTDWFIKYAWIFCLRGRGDRGERDGVEGAARSSRPSSPFSARLCLSLASVPQLLWMGKERDCAQSNTPRTEGAHRWQVHSDAVLRCLNHRVQALETRTENLDFHNKNENIWQN